MQTHTITTYSFVELSEDAQRNAIEKLWDLNTGFDWWYESVLEDAKKVLSMLGVDVDNIYFSGFASQGDGACFTGSYRYKIGAAKAIKAYAPEDEELHRIAGDLQDLQQRNFYGLTASITHRGRYYHEHSVSVDVEHTEGIDMPDDTVESVAALLRDLMCWIYRSLSSEYDYLTGEEAIRESIEANDYEFTVEGDLY